MSATKEAGYVFLGEQIKAARERAGLTQRELAARTSITAVWLCNIEKGKRPVGLQTLMELAYSTGHELKMTLVPKKKGTA